MPNNRFTELFEEADKAFEGKYSSELNELMGLSKDEIDSIVPGTTDLKTYATLIKVVENASKSNQSKTKLASDIQELGDTAVKIAMKIPKLAAILL